MNIAEIRGIQTPDLVKKVSELKQEKIINNRRARTWKEILEEF